MLTFHIGQNDVRTVGDKARELRLLRGYLTLSKAYFIRRRGRVKVRKGKIRFFGWYSKRFAYGLWPNVKHFLEETGIRYRAYTKRKPLPLLDTKKIGDTKLYGYQFNSINRWLKRGGSGIVWAAAGAGKTEMAAAAISHLLKHNIASKVLFIVNGLDLLDQAEERLRLRLKRKIGTISGGGVNLKRTVTVSAIQKIDNLIKNEDKGTLDFLREVDFLVYDETHHGRSEQSARLSSKCWAPYRLGISARPLHISYDTYKEHDLKSMSAEDARVVASLGPVVSRVPASKLIRINRLAQPTIYLYPLNYKDWRDNRESELEDLDWSSAKRKLIVRNSVIHSITARCVLEAAKADETTLVIAGGSRELGLSIYNEIRDANLNVVYLHGGIKKDFRTKSRHKLIKKRLDACIATTIYDEGIDIPNVRLLVLAYGGLSAIKNEQRLGRGLRNKIGMNEAIVIDFINYGNKYLRKHSYARLQMYLEEDMYKVKLVTRRHSPYVVSKVGRDNIVDELPNVKDFKKLKSVGGKP